MESAGSALEPGLELLGGQPLLQLFEESERRIAARAKRAIVGHAGDHLLTPSSNAASAERTKPTKQNERTRYPRSRMSP
jgi:hypothetical protein